MIVTYYDHAYSISLDEVAEPWYPKDYPRFPRGLRILYIHMSPHVHTFANQKSAMRICFPHCFPHRAEMDYFGI